MRILGISPLDKDSTVSFVEDGRVVFACGEERLSRVKLQSGFPHRALQLGLATTGWKLSDIDIVAYAFFDAAEETRLIRRALEQDATFHRSDATAASLKSLQAARTSNYKVDRSQLIPGFTAERDEFLPTKPWLKRTVYNHIATFPFSDRLAHRHYFKQWARTAEQEHKRWNDELNVALQQYGLAGKLQRFHHHDTHAANSFFASGYDQSLIVTLDGYGSGGCGGIYVGDSHGVRPLHRFDFPNSLGIFYEQVTSALGFKPSRHEGKIVGLAAYGDPRHLTDTLLNRFVCEQGDIRIRASLNQLFARALAGSFSKRDIAATYQSVLEAVTQKTVEYWVNKTGLSNISMSGGVHANVKLNQRIREIAGVQSVYVYPNMGDGGCGTGAALLAFGAARKGPVFDNVYLGPEYSEAQIRSALQHANLPDEPTDNLEDRVAELLAGDFIVGRFNGRMEYGPRALGNRSVLYPAGDPEVNQWLNRQLGRTEFMPFAPAVLAEEAHRLFHNLEGCQKSAEYMTLTFDCTDEMVRLCPAAVHIDRTARPQLVSSTSNNSFYRILRGYYERTGIPAIINTSFNMHEEPIVCSPEDAIRAFLLGNLDYLAIGNCLVPHPRLNHNQQARRSAQTAALTT